MRPLEAPLDVIVVRKLGLPRWPEVAMGAIGEVSHGADEFYAWRAEFIQRLILVGRCTWIGAGGD